MTQTSTQRDVVLLTRESDSHYKSANRQIGPPLVPLQRLGPDLQTDRSPPSPQPSS